MAEMSLKDIRTQLLDEIPVQWTVLLEMAEFRMQEGGFTKLRDFIETPYVKGGLGIPIWKARELIYFNSDYKHKAQELDKALGVGREVTAIFLDSEIEAIRECLYSRDIPKRVRGKFHRVGRMFDDLVK